MDPSSLNPFAPLSPQDKDFFEESHTVESLIEQNDDLMARIAAFSKKNAQLEKRCKIHELEKKSIEQKVETLSEQLLILREKDRIIHQRLQNAEGALKQSREDRKLTEIRFSELHQTSNQTRETLVLQLSRLARFRSWAKESLYPAYRTLKILLDEAEQKITAQMEEEEHLREKIEEIHHTHETEKAQLESQLGSFRSNARAYSELVPKFNDLKDERTAQSNRLIAAERLNIELREQIHEETLAADKEISKYRTESKSLRLENQSQKENLIKIEEDHRKLRTRNDRLSDQNESLQELWSESRTKMDVLDRKVEALQKLNQEMASQLKSSRQKTTEIEKELSQERQAHRDEKRLFETEIELLRSNKQESTEESDQELLPEKKTVEPIADPNKSEDL